MTTLAQQLAFRNLRELEALLARFGPGDTGPGRERVAAQLEAARAAVRPTNTEDQS